MKKTMIIFVFLTFFIISCSNQLNYSDYKVFYNDVPYCLNPFSEPNYFLGKDLSAVKTYFNVNQIEVSKNFDSFICGYNEPDLNIIFRVSKDTGRVYSVINIYKDYGRKRFEQFINGKNSDKFKKNISYSDIILGKKITFDVYYGDEHNFLIGVAHDKDEAKTYITVMFKKEYQMYGGKLK